MNEERNSVFSGAKSEHSAVSSEHLHNHDIIPTSNKPFKCKICDKTFVRKSDLTKHERKLLDHKNINTSKRPFSCTRCDKTFGRKEHLVIHIRVHTGTGVYILYFSL